MSGFLHKIAELLEAIKFQHSVFALPFALTATLLALRETAMSGPDLAWKLVWIIIAMVAARSAAMAFNRLVDARTDALNPRTAGRALPAGRLSKQFAAVFVSISAAVLVLAAWQLNPLCFKLSPLALALAFGYSYTKRFTALSHIVLGAVLGVAPAAAWIAVRGTLDPAILLLALAVTLWTAGFDIIYSCQDVAFDRSAGLHSIPARFGVATALLVSRLLHVGMVVCLLGMWLNMGLGLIALLGVAATAGLLVYEQSLVSADDLSRVDAAFFTVNGWASVLFFAFWAVDLWLPLRLPA
ncbi:MAG: 4-hydroxybenzoate octaprenyltransferase [Acidobacteriia bacterium]|nr:4-hydroxybenzoate octaprenyltransferase [Terriglobia bacterium]MYG03487.1 4-hydroxybenzoate octaprenyltransferase [Terriglobia bacterium]MYK09421.1 4-hydroxybenzoate octaprenyltransferase [Terriglobia bacterium]